jgi:hypothetical protein
MTCEACYRRAKKFLSAVLSDGPLPVKEIVEAAQDEFISNHVLARAKDDLSIIVRLDTQDKNWLWQLPRQGD